MSKRKITFIILMVLLLSLTMMIVVGCNKATPSTEEQETPQPADTTCTVSFYFLPTDEAPTFTRTVEKGVKIQATKIPNPTRDGFEFGGWYKDKACQNAFNTSSVITSNLSLYALWIAPYRILFYLDTFTDEPDKVEKIFSTDRLPESKIYTPQKDGYDFDGWYLDKEFQTKYVYSPTVTSNLSLYARFISQYATITFETSYATGIAPTQARIGEEATLPTPERDGCSFGGWYLDSGLTELIENSKLTPTASLTVYAKWTVNHAHTYNTSASTYKYPTCTEVGKSANICTICGEIEAGTITDIPALGHNWNEGTYVDGGSYHYIACTRCREQKDKQGHVWDEGTIIEDATCTEDGSRSHHCTLCSATKVSAIEATGHTYDQTSFVSDEDYHWFECTKCHEVMPNTKEAHHKVRDTSKDVVSTSCDKENVEGYYCDICEHDCSKHTAAKQHTPSTTWTYDANGHWKVCTECGAILDYHEHNLTKDEDRHDPSTCIHHGHDIYTCSCGYEKEVQLEFTDHTFTTASGGWVLYSDVSAADSKYTDAQKALLQDYDFKICQVCGKECELTEHDLIATQKNTWVTAKCNQEGYEKYRCKRCGIIHEEHLPMTAHKHPTDESQITILQAATCTHDGLESYECASCHQIIEETIEAGHKWEIIDESAATCTINGYIRRECHECHEYEEVILYASHKFNDNYSYDEHGHWYTCAVCGEKTGEGDHHLIRTVYGEYSCTGTITVLYSCDICGYRSSLTEITGPGHDWDEGVKTKDSTCVVHGEITYTCKACGETRIEYLDLIDHTYDEGHVTRQPTCTVKGVKTYTCTVCGHEKYEDIEPLGHDFSDVGVVSLEPGCTTTGILTHHCSRCDATQDEVIPALGHSYSSSTVTLEPTCTATGIRTFTCDRCGEHITEDIPALGHDWNAGEVTTQPTCTATGIKTFTCQRCGATKTETVAALGHDYQDTVTPPTCTQKGYTTHHCNRCGHEEVDTYVNALGHNYVGHVVHPTCKAQGYTRYTCTRCGDHYDGNYTPKTSHLHHGFVCVYCNDSMINSYLSTFNGHGANTSDPISIANDSEFALFLDYLSANYITTKKYVRFAEDYIPVADINTQSKLNNVMASKIPLMTTTERNLVYEYSNDCVGLAWYINKTNFNSASNYASHYGNEPIDWYDEYYDQKLYEKEQFYFAPTSTRSGSWDDFGYKGYDGSFTCTTSDQLVYALTNCMKPTVSSGTKVASLVTSAKNVLREICDDTMTDEEKVVAIYKWLVSNVLYDTYAENVLSTEYLTYLSNYAESVFGLIINNKSKVVEYLVGDNPFASSLGFAKAFVVLTGLEGIRSVVVTGEQSGNLHYWNKVLIDTDDDGLKEWYAIDLTAGVKTKTISATTYDFMSTEGLLVSDTYLGYIAENYTDCTCSTMYNYYVTEELNLYITSQAQMDTLATYLLANATKITTYKSVSMFVVGDYEAMFAARALNGQYELVNEKQATINNAAGYIVTIAI